FSESGALPDHQGAQREAACHEGQGLRPQSLGVAASSSAFGRHRRPTSLGRYKASERRREGSLVLVPESVDEVIAEIAERPLGGEDVPRHPRSSQRGRFPGERLMSPTYELATGFAGEFAL